MPGKGSTNESLLASASLKGNGKVKLVCRFDCCREEKKDQGRREEWKEGREKEGKEEGMITDIMKLGKDERERGRERVLYLFYTIPSSKVIT